MHLLNRTLIVSLLLLRSIVSFATEADRWTDPFSGITLVRIPAGEFQMGSPISEAQRNPDETLHKVTITHFFYMAEHEVTQGQWKKVMGNHPSWFRKCGSDCWLVKVNWFQANQFIDRLNQHSKAHFRLPTEAEWEYACRAGTNTPFFTGETLTTEQENYDGRYAYAGFRKGKNRGAPIRVGSFPPNAWDFLICTAMFGNGRLILIVPTPMLVA